MNKLTDTQIKQAKPKERDYPLADGGGLRLMVKKNGVKTWLFNYYTPYTKKKNNITIGQYPLVTLAQARAKRTEFKALLAQNIVRYPIDERQPTIQNVAGYRMMLTERNDKEYFYLYPLAFDEAIKGNPKEQACNILSDKGMLKKGNEQGYKFMTKLPHKVDPKRTRCYLLMPITERETDSEELEQTG